MKTVSTASLAAVISGLVAFLVFGSLWPTIAVEHFTNVIGLVAIAGGAAGAWWSRRRARSLPQQHAQGKTD